MTEQDEKLLLMDLCARIPYGVMCDVDYYDDPLVLEGIPNTDTFLFCNGVIERYASQVRPYLRPMSSMTDEERKELSDYLCEQVMSNKIGITIPPNPTQGKGIPFIWMGDCLNWLNAHHFDYRGLIKKGLALEAPEDMYNN